MQTQGVGARWRGLWLAAALTLFAVLAFYQLGLPGLHYDEAREAGVNAMELLTDAPVSAFRGASVQLFGRDLPLMVQDYIGALNVYLALPFLWLTGIGVPNLRALSILTGLAALLGLERAISAWVAMHRLDLSARSTPISVAGLIGVTLLAASPSFVFWSRQGIFVTNLTQPLVFVCIWQGLAWLRGGRTRALWISAMAGGLALYAKLLAVWMVGPFALLAGGWWLWRRWRGDETAPRLTLIQATGMIIAFLLPLTPLLLFNVQTGGTLGAVGGNLGQSYYGVKNSAVLSHIPLRARQIGQVLRGDHLWYLGGIYSNPLAPWLGLAAVAVGLIRRWRLMLGPLLLAGAAFVLSLFTLSDLFITHYALLQPLLAGVIALGLATLWPGEGASQAWPSPRTGMAVVATALLLWLGADLTATSRYHAALNKSGGLADHSDASYHLAYYLEYNGLGAPIALDWGMDAPARYLSRGRVQPIEVFGYDSPQAPDPDFTARLDPFLSNPDNVYLLRAPGQAVFTGRREAFMDAASASGFTPRLEQTFTQRDGAPLFEIWRVEP